MMRSIHSFIHWDEASYWSGIEVVHVLEASGVVATTDIKAGDGKWCEFDNHQTISRFNRTVGSALQSKSKRGGRRFPQEHRTSCQWWLPVIQSITGSGTIVASTLTCHFKRVCSIFHPSAESLTASVGAVLSDVEANSMRPMNAFTLHHADPLRGKMGPLKPLLKWILFPFLCSRWN